MTTLPETSLESGDRCILFTDWRGYSRILDLVGDGHTRVTFCMGKLELAERSEKQEAAGRLLCRLLECWMDYQGLDYQDGGSATFRNASLNRGLEPDGCFWIRRLWRTAEHPRYDADNDPPPDLAVEVEITRSAVSRMDMYRSLGVAEVWRWSPLWGLRVYCMTSEGEYEAGSCSGVLRGIPVEAVERFMREGVQQPTSRVVRSFRSWLAERVS